jgi:DNA ligase (NAD+)
LVKSGEEVALRCPNYLCEAQVIRRIEHFVSRGAMDIEGMGTAVVELFVKEGLIRDSADLYALKKEQIRELEGFGEKSADKLLESLAESKTRSPERFIFGLGIPYIGITAARTLAGIFPDINALMAATIEQLENIEGIGIKMAESLFRFFRKEINKNLIEKFRHAGINFKFETQGIDDSLTNMTFVLTGVLPSLTRDEASKIILDRGGKVSSAVSKGTSFVLAGEKAGSKLAKALKLGVPVLDESEFRKMIE